MRRNTSNWIARIFSIAAAGATPVVAGCNSSTGENSVDMRHETADEGVADLEAPSDADLGSPMSIRRPFLVGGSLRAAAPAAREDWLQAFTQAGSHADEARRTLPDEARRALAAAWLKDALDEHASVAAFARFTIRALEVGAPPELVADSQRASLDEIRHARICFGLARQFGATQAGPGPLRVDDAFGPSSLAEVAALTAAEGCVGESVGALLAERQAQAAEGALKEALFGIARDERRHAQLAWRFVAWASRVGGGEIVERVAESIHAAAAETRAMKILPPPCDLDLWHAHGRLSCVESRAVAEEALAEIVLPALAGLQARAVTSSNAA